MKNFSSGICGLLVYFTLVCETLLANLIYYFNSKRRINLNRAKWMPFAYSYWRKFIMIVLFILKKFEDRTEKS